MVRPPTATAGRFVNYVLWFGVAFAIGLSPFLGRQQVRLFTPLLELIPFTMQDGLIPISALLMGVVAVAVDWFGRNHQSSRWLAWNFRIALIATVLFLLLFVTVQRLVVVSVPIREGVASVPVLIGLQDRPVTPPCGRQVSDAECVQRLTLDPAQIESFWGSRSMRQANLALTACYLAITASFAWLVGLLVIAGAGHQREGNLA